MLELSSDPDIYNPVDSKLVERGLSGAEANGNMGLPKDKHLPAALPAEPPAVS